MPDFDREFTAGNEWTWLGCVSDCCGERAYGQLSKHGSEILGPECGQCKHECELLPIPADGQKLCPTCDGFGWDSVTKTTCRRCKDTGLVDDEPTAAQLDAMNREPAGIDTQRDHLRDAGRL